MNTYSAFGLEFESILPIPELRNCRLSSDQPILIKEAPLPPELKEGEAYDPYMQYCGQKCLYSFPKIGRYLIEDGCRITIDREPASDIKDVRAFLLGSVMGTLLHQRQLIPLHVSVVRTPAGLVAFTGESGAGKSTIAAILNKHLGWSIACDDMSVLQHGAEGPSLVGGVLRIKLWKDSLDLVEPRADAIEQDATRFDKYHVRLGSGISAEPGKLIAMIHLSEGRELQLQRITGGRAGAVLLNAIYRPYLAGLFNDLDQLSSTILSSAACLQVFSLTRPKRADRLGDVVSVIAAQFDNA